MNSNIAFANSISKPSPQLMKSLLDKYRSINALAETINGLYKNELIKPRKPWRTVDEVELATLEWVWWFNNSRLHSELNYQTPAEYEANYYASQPAKTPTGVLVKH